MGQRKGVASRVTPANWQWSSFATPLGHFGLLGRDSRLWRITFGHSTSEAAWDAMRRAEPDLPDTLPVVDWSPEIREALQAYTRGESAALDAIPIDLRDRTEFQRKVLLACRQVKYGEQATYGDLARRVGSPQAARAVGAVMASNRLPLIIPCHRIVGSGGQLVGFSAPNGTDLKRRLLELEQSCVEV